MIEAVLRVTLPAFALGGAGLHVASRAAAADVRSERRVKFVTYFAVVHTVLLAAMLGRVMLAAVFGVVLGAGAAELFRAGRPLTALWRSIVVVAYIALGAGMIAFAHASTAAQAVYVYLIVATFDGFSQVAGQLFGVTTLAPTISPGKTLEGSVAGAAAACAVAVLLRRMPELDVTHALAAGAALASASLAGDLCASWLKRRCAIKDFGALLPGHGGVLDRFDSLLFAIPVALLLGL